MKNYKRKINSMKNKEKVKNQKKDMSDARKKPLCKKG